MATKRFFKQCVTVTALLAMIFACPGYYYVDFESASSMSPQRLNPRANFGKFKIGTSLSVSGNVLDVAASTAATNLDLGASGTAGSLDIFPATASKGKLTITCTDSSSGNYGMILTNAAGASSTKTVTIPSLTGYVGLSTAALTLAEMDVLYGVTAGTAAASKALVADANIDIGTLRNITATGTVSAEQLTSTDDATIANLLTLGANGATGTAGTITINDGANPGASTTITQPELAMIDGITAGTQAAGKAVVADANVNTGVSKITELHIGATGAETQVTATAAELNYTDVTTLGTAQASKAVTADANVDVTGLRNVTATGTVTAATFASSAGNGAIVANKCTAVETGDGVIHKTVLTFTLTGDNDIDVADGGASTGVKVYDMPEGRILILGATIDASTVTNNVYNASTNDIYYVSVGTVDGTQAADADLTGTEADIIPKTTLDTIDSSTLTLPWKTTLATSAAFDGTTTPVDIFVNVAVPNDSNTGATTHAITGTMTITWINLGDY